MVSLLIVLFAFSMLYVASSSRIEAYIKVLAFQGLCLFLLVLAIGEKMDTTTMVFLSVETLLFKTCVLPGFLFWIVRRNSMRREVAHNLSGFHSLLIVTAIFAVGLFVPVWAGKTVSDLNPLFFGSSTATILTGLFIILTRKRIVTHVMGYMMIENGVFLLSLASAKEMPMIVNVGVLLDVFIAIFVLGLFVNKIQTVFDESQVETLSNLKD